MDTISDGKSLGSAENQPDKWLERIATAQAENRALRAQLSVARGLIAGTTRTADKWDSGGQPCWCGAPDDEDASPAHATGCTLLRRLVRQLGEELGALEP